MKTKHTSINAITKWSTYLFSYSSANILLRFALFVTPLIATQLSCKKLVEVNAPFTSINAANVYSSDETAIAVLTGIYANMSTATYGPATFTQGWNSISLLAGLSADEFTLYSGVTSTTYVAYYRNTLSVTKQPTAGSEHWSELYNGIFICNSALEGLNKSTSLTSIIKQQLIGEAKFMRAFFTSIWLIYLETYH